MLSNPVWRLRMVGMAEAVSYIALLGIAMPLKYMADMPFAVRIAGSIHGALFVIFVITLMQAWLDRSWNVKLGAKVFVSCLLPFGPFFLDGQLKIEQEASSKSSKG